MSNAKSNALNLVEFFSKFKIQLDKMTGNEINLVSEILSQAKGITQESQMVVLNRIIRNEEINLNQPVVIAVSMEEGSEDIRFIDTESVRAIVGHLSNINAVSEVVDINQKDELRTKMSATLKGFMIFNFIDTVVSNFDGAALSALPKIDDEHAKEIISKYRESQAQEQVSSVGVEGMDSTTIEDTDFAEVVAAETNVH